MKIKVLIGISTAILLSGCVGTQGEVVYSSNLKGLSMEQKAARMSPSKSFERDLNNAKYYKNGTNCYEFKTQNKLDFLTKEAGIHDKNIFLETLRYKEMNGNIIVYSRGNHISAHTNLKDCLAFTDNEQK